VHHLQHRGESCPQQAGSCLTLALQMRSPSMPPKSCLTINWCMSMILASKAALPLNISGTEDAPMRDVIYLIGLID
jgi:hypothetical protein